MLTIFHGSYIFTGNMDKRRVYHFVGELLSRSLDESWTVKRMADEAHLSVSRFHRVFMDEFHMSPMAYLHDMRLSRAYAILEDPHNFDSVKMIAYKVGIADTSHFARDFRKKYGRTPTEHRDHFFQMVLCQTPLTRKE